jgi:hypothetical protein
MDETLDQPQPWERQPDEPNRWFDRFERYRLAGPSRSLLGILNAERQQKGAAKGKSLPQAWANNATQWRWRQRAAAWDEQQRQQARLAHAQQIEEMNHRHIQEARALQSKALQRLRALDVDSLSEAAVLRYLLDSAKLERTALAAPPSNAEEPRRTSEGGPVPFTLEDAVRAEQELEQWHHERQQRSGGALPPGDPQVP